MGLTQLMLHGLEGSNVKLQARLPQSSILRPQAWLPQASIVKPASEITPCCILYIVLLGLHQNYPNEIWGSYNGSLILHKMLSVKINRQWRLQ